MEVTAISGGIGSGKSVVARILSVMGYKVYDCDSRAKTIMDSDPAIKRSIREIISPEAITHDGQIDRRRLGEIVFADPDKLARLNAIVHGAVRRDIARWIKRNEHDERLFIETAILYQSGLDIMVDSVLEVTADTDVRVDRVCRRNGLTAEEVMQRIASQHFVVDNPHPHVTCIDNSGHIALLPQILAFLGAKHTNS